VGVGSGLAEAGAHRIDDARIDFLAVLVAQAQALHDAGTEVVGDHVGVGDQRLHQVHLCRVAQVDFHAALVAVQAAEDRVVLAGNRVEGRAAQVARALALDLDHVGAVVGEHLRAHRPHHDLGEIDHAHALEWQSAGGGAHAATLTSASARASASAGTSGLALL
jgi:hypothetical protein